MTTTTPVPLDAAGRPIDIDNALAFVEKAQQLAGHYPSDEDMAAARRVILGESTEDAEIAKALAKYRR